MKTRLLTALWLFGALTLASAQTIPNPSFEFNSFTNGVGYIANNGPIVGWTTTDTNHAGLNPAASSPFANNSFIPDGTNVAFIQSSTNSSLSTVISNLIVGQTYKVNFRANARSGNTANLKVYVAGNNVINTTVTAVGDFNPYNYFDFYFMATDVTNTLTVLNDASGDNTLLVDNFSIAPSPISNPSFEFNSFTNGPGYISGNTNIVGWTTTDPAHAGLNTASGPFADNGTIPDGNNVAFIQSLGGNSSLSTVFSNLTVGQTYKVNFRVNARNSPSYIPNLNVSIDTSNIVNSTVTPVYSKNPYRYFAFDFTAGATNQTMTLRNDATSADNTVLVDAFDIGVRNSGWSYAAWSNDASAGIIGNPTNYTHAYNFGSDSNVIINGVTFTNTGSANGNPANSLFFTTGLPDVYNNDNNNLTTETNQGSAVLAHDFLWGGPSGASESITIGHLLTGNSYVATIYSVGYHGDTGIYTSRTATFNVGNDYLTVNQDQFGYGNGIRVSYAYTATSDTITLTYVPLEGGQTFYTYGFCNVLLTNGHAALLIVTNLADSGEPGTLRRAIADAVPGDTITFATNGVIKLTRGELNINKDLTIAGPGPANLAIDAGGANSVVEISTGHVILGSLTLTNGYSFSGGGILVDSGATLTITNCTLSGNSATAEGGGIYCASGSTLTINNSTLSGNSASDYGGGIFNNAGTLTINNSTLSGNSATTNNGGGIYNEGTNTLLNNCTLSGNSAPNGFGGGIINNVLTLTMTNCTLSGNSAGLGGGGINNEDGGTVTVNNSTLSSNTISSSSGGGGGIYNAPGSMFTVNSCILSGNSAPNGNSKDITGGAILNSGSMAVNNSTLSSNSSGGAGGAIGNIQAILTVNNSTLSNNTAKTDDGGGIYDYGYNNGATNTLNNCTLSGNSAAGYGGGIANDLNSILIVNTSTLSGNTAGFGGGIANDSTLTVNNSTLSGNSATINVATDGGGGIWNQGTSTLNSCTLSGNSAPNGYGGGMNNNAGSLSSINTIVAGNNALTYPDLYNAFGSFSGADNLTNGIPLLAPLGNYGGPTQTMPPLSGSPAIDAGTDSVTNFLPTDQRGYPRLSGARVDIGAVEAQWAPGGNPPFLTSPAHAPAGTFSFSFTSVPNADFSVLTSTNVAVPLGKWGVFGVALQYAPGQYRFTDSAATNYSSQFYRVVSP